MAIVRRQLLPALVAFLFLTLLTGVAYPLAVTGIAQAVFPGRADGSLVERDGVVVGSRLIGQPFAGARWFHPRPSAAGDGYDAMASSASNLGPTNLTLLAEVRRRAAAYRRENGLSPGAPVPQDAVTSSGSGLDPQISVANARIQAARVARARGLPLAQVLVLVAEHTDGRALGFLGEPGVNVLELDLALDGNPG
ncbi:MAG TPA: K(+)-transporting ATPase subunit C [Gaiella sp.]|jgi:K+-transporting ATPase ATPase C chain|nr:K(+)-transporting ATPase subunit C [Gaiella sp.]